MISLPKPPENLWPSLDLSHTLTLTVTNMGDDDISADPGGKKRVKLRGLVLLSMNRILNFLRT